MSPLVQMDAEDVKRLIHDRMSRHPELGVVRAVSVERYPQEFAVTVWVGQEPTPAMREAGYALESELANLGIACSIIIKSDQDLPFRGVHALQTSKGDFSYRYYRTDPAGDEDQAYVFTVNQGPKTYRFRMSLTGTLASMLRNRNELSEDRILGVYRDWIASELVADHAAPDEIHRKQFSSTELGLFTST